MRDCSDRDCTKIWRPWDDDTTKAEPTKCKRLHPYARHPGMNNPMQPNAHPLQSYMSTFKHPVRLYWTKAAYDYMYEAGERLLRNFPVQATIQVIDESDSSDEEEDDEEDFDNHDDDEEKTKENDAINVSMVQDHTESKKVEEKKHKM